jgi:hypothetical protein
MSERTNVSNIGVGGQYRTYKIDDSTITYSATAAGGSSQVGLAVTFSADDTVALTCRRRCRHRQADSGRVG